ncbi:MAG: WYL domain-containing protein [Burkholderiaceae bacterium]|nr:WYL domain-containing protein [Burkholderiaceae bacterium]
MESLLLWEGSLDNGRIREVFNVQAVQASRLLSSFAEHYKDMLYRPSAHAPIQATSAFQAKLGAATPDEYLRLLQSAGNQKATEHIEDARLDFTSASAAIFAAAVQACRQRCGLRIFYRSMNDPKGRERLVFPHTIVRVARRWHLRAWCSMREEFRDFTVGRIAHAALDDSPSPATASEDIDWVTTIELKIVAHPNLNTEQEMMIRSEYFGGMTARTQKVRRCLVAYTLQDLRIAIDVQTQKPPEYQLALFNVANIEPELLGFQR